MSVLGRIRAAIRSEDEIDRDFECQNCGSGFDLQRQVCPDCGSYSIDSVAFSDVDRRR
jgi:uncharacterized OB-fold protein